MSKVREFYDSDAAEYDKKRFTEDDWQNNIHQRLLCDFLTNIPSGSRILEVGCGTGRFTATLVKQGFDTFALDLSNSMLRETRQRCQRTDTQKQPVLLNGDVSQLPFNDNYFDACVMINVASHIPEPKEAFSEIGRVVGNGGKVFTNFPNLYSPYLPIGIFVNLFGRSVQEDVYSRWYSWGEIERILNQADLHAEKIRGHMIAPRNNYTLVNKLIKMLDTISRDNVFRFVTGSRFYQLRVGE